MKSLVVPCVLAGSIMLALTSCVRPPPPPPPPPPPAPIAAPAPQFAPAPYVAPMPPPRAYRGCPPGTHWVHKHRTRRGHWVRGHCAPNRW